MILVMNGFPDDKIITFIKLKAFADNKFNMEKMIISVFDGVENIVRQGENACYQHFLLFPRCFYHLSVSGSLQLWIVW